MSIVNNNTLYGLPSKVKFCKKCVVSNQRPSTVVETASSIKNQRKPTIEFDDKGVCSACRFAEKKKSIDWEQRDFELKKLCDKYRSRNGNYDCIVPGSGGKDSVFTAHILKAKYNMNPLTVTWAPHLFTEIGWKNLQSWINSGFDNFLHTPNGRVHRKLTKLAFENIYHPFQSFIIGQKLIGPRFSVFYKVPLVFYGENQAEYGNNIKENDSPLMKKEFFLRSSNLDKLFLSGLSVEQLVKDHHFSVNDLNPYLPIERNLLEKNNTEIHYLGYYIKWDPQECYYYSAEKCGFESNVERTEGTYSKYSSIDDVLDYLHWYTTFIKFGIGHATHDASQEIRNDKINREEAVSLVRKYDGELPKSMMDKILNYLDINQERFDILTDKSRSPHLWEKNDNCWKLKFQVE